MITLITLALIGWLISFGMAIYGMIISWRDKIKSDFYESGGLFLISIPFGYVIGWAAVVAFIKDTMIDKHFDN